MQCNLATFKAHSKQVWILEWRWTNFTVVREVLHNNYWSPILIDPLFTRLFLARRRTRAGHETNLWQELTKAPPAHGTFRTAGFSRQKWQHHGIDMLALDSKWQYFQIVFQRRATWRISSTRQKTCPRRREESTWRRTRLMKFIVHKSSCNIHSEPVT